jgi:HEAT repeat protein
MRTEEIVRLARAAVSLDPDEPANTLRDLGDPDGETLAAAALERMTSGDRNVRVAMLRVLALAGGPEAVRGILLGLDDEKKRVREVAAKSSARFVTDERVAKRLERAVRDGERGSSGPAFQILAGLYAAPYRAVPNPMLVEALGSLAESTRHRPAVLTALVRSRLTDEVRSLLHEIVRHGTKQEAVIATRRLCGYRVARLEEFPPDEQPAIRRTCERAWGDVWYWVPEALLSPLSAGLTP